MSNDVDHMARAIELAARGEGWVEPNPMVGCVIVRDGKRIAEGWHRRFGGPHAEVEALLSLSTDAAGSTMYVTLEPCCHAGKTPPCTDAIMAAQLARVVVAQRDPFPAVAGKGIEVLRRAGISVDVGVLKEQAQRLNAPYRMLIEKQRPWMIAKWAMTLDGRIASRTGHSRWISGEASRRIVHQLRGRVDAVMVGRRTAELDDPQLTARPSGARCATRIVVDSRASLSTESRLIRSVHEVPVLVAVGPHAASEQHRRLENAGCEVLVCPAEEHPARLLQLLAALGQRRMTNVLVEGGGQLIGCLFDLRRIDEVHVFIAPKIVGGDRAPGPVGGLGRGSIPSESTLSDPRIEVLEQDVYITGRLSNDSREQDV
jgi:diaminohydroxyphosphoribosylaminopyrimidine deaminase/5-amino-6-(5-phosphoribosylamino)uracil reductase